MHYVELFVVVSSWLLVGTGWLIHVADWYRVANSCCCWYRVVNSCCWLVQGGQFILLVGAGWLIHVAG